ncbi:MAG TPA: thiol:disulfide interchange protein DsbA/DsbL [Rhodocyclaceae bacterium]|nr:thiol:disulfide interchange protein DsbA/DsbL [Rhodocyclaceae bacterium]HNH35110.1 thiol:disulfide interchange protein DsbA/DsbL [Rhodocyclaceae bacterium]
MTRLPGFILTLALAAAVILSGPAAAQAQLQEGRDFVTLSPAQPVDAKGKVEVIEFFSYACPHCNDFDPILDKWIKRLPKDVEVRKVPVTFKRAAWANLAKLYYALDTIGETGRLHAKVFEAFHAKNVNLGDEKTAMDWALTQGVDMKKFQEAWNGFGMAGRVANGQAMAEAYKIGGVPTLAVAGRYVVVGKAATTYEDLLRIADALIQRARNEGLVGK